MVTVSDVEARVAELEERVELLESQLTGTDHSVVGRDPYDSAVIEKLAQADGSVSVSKMQKWYRNAGVRSKSKIRERIKDLHEAGFIEHVGHSDWRYVGHHQDTLGETA